MLFDLLVFIHDLIVIDFYSFMFIYYVSTSSYLRVMVVSFVCVTFDMS